MKILQINNVYNSGSTGKIVHDIHNELISRGFESIVCYANGPKVRESGVYKISSTPYQKIQALRNRITGLMYGGCIISTMRIFSIIKKEKPDIVHLQCINGHTANIYRLVTFLKKNHIKTILTLHAEFMYTANCGHAYECNKWKTGCGHCPRLREETKTLIFDRTHHSWKKMKRAFDQFNTLKVVSVSPWLMERAKCSPILIDKEHHVIFNGIDTDVFHPYNTESLKMKHNLTNEYVIFHPTVHFNNDPEHIKGGYYVLKLAEMLKNKNIKFFIAGSYDKSINPPPNVVLLGHLTNQSVLAQYYSMADLSLLTSRKETFSMIVAESLCCGTPIVGFKAGGPEQIALKEYSEFVEHGNIDELHMTIIKWLSYKKSCANSSNIVLDAVNSYSKKEMTNKYIGLYKDLKKHN